MRKVIIQHNKILVSRLYLIELNIKEKLVDNWGNRYPLRKTIINERLFFDFDLIPKPSRSKLPPKEELIQQAKQEELDCKSNFMKDAFVEGINKYYSDFLNEINKRYPNLNGDYKRAL